MYNAVRPLSDALGIEILGLKLHANLSDDELAYYESLILKHKVVVFRNQEISPLEQIEICRQFGDVEPHPLKKNTCPYKEMTVISNIKENGEAIGYPGPSFHLWHTDMCYEKTPPKFSFLYAEQVPDTGGKTLFSNTTLAYEDLDSTMKLKLEGKKGVFGFSQKLMDRCKALGYNLTIDEEDWREDVLHDLIRTHPLTGKKSIFANWTHTDNVVGMEEKESQDLLNYLYEYIAKPQYVYAHQYQKNDLVVWDNAATLHTGDGTVSVNQPRVMRRVVVRYKKSKRG